MQFIYHRVTCPTATATVFRHDHSRIVQPHKTSFVLTHEAFAIDMQKKMLEYATDLFSGPRPMSSQPTQTASGKSEPPQKKNRVHLETENGIPIMPAVTEEVKKKYMVELVRRYLTAQYGETLRKTNHGLIQCAIHSAGLGTKEKTCPLRTAERTPT